MATLNATNETLEQRVEIAIKAMPVLESNSAQPGASIGSVVSPIHRGVESACFPVDTSNQSLFLKVRFPDMDRFFDESAVSEGAQRASDLGIGPKLVDSHPGSGSYLFERLDAGWSWGKVDHFASAKVLENTVRAKKKLHESGAFASDRSVFRTIESYLSIVGEEKVTVPASVSAAVQKVREIEHAIVAAGISLVPCHCDGVSSNVLVSDDNQIRLVDFDIAGNADPYFDLGSLIVEVAQFPDHARQVIEMYEGECKEAVYNRCRLYGIADDLMWALWGFISFVSSPRKEVEFVKYAEWRLLRSIFGVEDPDFDRWINRL